MASRSAREKAIDNLLLLYSISEANRHGRAEGITKLVKIIFKAEHSLQKERIKAFSYPFVRYHYGPFSFELGFEDYQGLVEEGLITSNARLTAKGNAILREMAPVFEDNKEIMARIAKVVRAESGRNLAELKKEIYAMTIKTPAGDLPIGEMPEKTPLLINLPEENAKKIFKIDEGWLETLMTYLNAEECESLKAAAAKAKGERALTYARVFGG
ncbi:MAG: hypothetical protein V1676_01030 [Candidatus Diapherotrites archaeon]